MLDSNRSANTVSYSSSSYATRPARPLPSPFDSASIQEMRAKAEPTADNCGGAKWGGRAREGAARRAIRQRCRRCRGCSPPRKGCRRAFWSTHASCSMKCRC
uniref:Uncharacterized protein n=1 Tax=Setaria viridis TaxID=4556 RepID=A0A4U6W537_SETVI|nr:hypothetical protein SEVIR_2G180300v2 [Setaria viridis]